jgi:multidrug efflux pump subunit AcrA (membrane-fusion protein)
VATHHDEADRRARNQTDVKGMMNFTTRRGMNILAVVVCLGGVGIIAERVAASRPPADSKAAEARPRAELVRPRRLTVARHVQTNATLEAFEQTDLFAKVSGYLSDVRVDIGDHVKAGQVLSVIDIPEMGKELAEAKAQLESKQKALETALREVEHHKADVTLQDVTLKRQEALFEGRAITDQTLDEVRAKTQIARADLGVAEANRAFAAAQVNLAAATVEKIRALVGYEQVVAPFDGVVARRLVNRGDLVQAATSTRTTPLFTVQRIDTMRVFCDVPEDDVPHLRVGDAATVRPAGFDGQPYVGKVTRFSLRVDAETRNMRTEVDLPNPEERLYPGMYAQVSLEMNAHPNAMTLPAAAVGSDGDGHFVYSVHDNRITRVAVKIGLADNGNIEVIAGLADDTPVVAVIKGAPPPGTLVQPSMAHGNS